MRNKPKDRVGILGLGAVACAACCAGPIIAFLGGIAALGAVGTVLAGGAAALIAAALIVVVLVWLRRRVTRCEVASVAVALDPPMRRTVTQR